MQLPINCISSWGKSNEEDNVLRSGFVAANRLCNMEFKPNDQRWRAIAVTVSESEKKSPEQIQLFEDDILDRKYKVLADLEVVVNKTTIFHDDPTPEMAAKKLQEEAAGIGADAVILVRYGTVGVSFMSWGSIEGKGRAIKFM
ncbi:hypothetical protein [Sneathiella glossodoripedis]|uniref:hypothetical protein n=1 Tax=Sneathiella glossodoripedis TaxID=418853 RepID=UPI0011DD216D|nr:hypothetical protein [Sneathiella glossodoripedis]